MTGALTLRIGRFDSKNAPLVGGGGVLAIRGLVVK